MANELNIQLDQATQTGLAVRAIVRAADGTQEGSTTTITEVASTAYYTGDFSLAAVSDGLYSVEFYNNADNTLLGTGELRVLNNAEFDPAPIDTIVKEIKGATAGKKVVNAAGTQVLVYDFAGNLLVTLDRTGTGPYTWTPTWA